MKNKVIWLAFSFLMVTAMLIASCTTSTTKTSSTTSPQTSTSAPTSTSTTSAPSTTSSATTSTVAGNWWNKLGTPQYGGTMTIRLSNNIVNFDPYFSRLLTTIQSAYMEKLFAYDWTLDPSVYNYPGQFCPDKFIKGFLATAWEFTDPSTIVVHLRQGVHWQNIPPANGREFVASDVAFHYNRLCGLGDGYTKPTPYPAGYNSTYFTIKSVTAPDKYTVIFKFSTSNEEFILETLEASATSEQCFESPDAVKQWGDVNDWHRAIGTGPFILTDFVDGASATLIKNSSYWGYDERYPQNQLPYVSGLKILIIPDDATALSGLRTGKIDELDRMPIQSAQDLARTNPEILQIEVPWTVGCLSIEPRNDTKPFTDIKVRQAMQMAIDLPTIAKTYYQGHSNPNPQSLISSYVTGYGFPYEQWPQDLKDEYAYNPTAAKKLLSDAGYPNGFNTDIIVDNGYDMSLLQIVKSYFAAVGINMTIQTMDIAAWSAYVETNKKHDQLSARSTASYLGATTEPIQALTRLSTLANTDGSVVNSTYLTTAYQNAMAATTVDLAKQIIKDACEYVTRQHFEVSLLEPNAFCFVQPWVNGYNGQYAAFSGGSSGPSLLAFFQARFWIDQNLKKSMGH